jgi:hypothetical protein
VFQGRFAGVPAVAAAGAGEVVGVQVVSIPVGVGSGLAEGSDGDHHEAGIHLGETGVVELPVAHLPRRVVFDQHVGVLDQAQQQLPPAGRGHIQSDATFVGVEKVEETALLEMRPVLGERTPVPGEVSVFGRLDLDDVGPVVAEQLGTVGCRDPLTEFDDPDPFESSIGHLASFQ